MEIAMLLGAVEIGQYISPWKPVPVLVVLLLWARLLTWADKDAIIAFLPRIALNVANVAGLVLAFAIFFLLPINFWIGFTILVLLMGIEVTVYLILRNQKVGLTDLRKQFRDWVNSFGKKEKAMQIAAGQVVITGPSGAAMVPPEPESPDRVAYDMLQDIFTDPLRKGAESIAVTPTDTFASLKYVVDGVAYDGQSLNKSDAAAAVSYLKAALGLDVNDRRKPQLGSGKAVLNGKKHEMRVVTSGSTAGEQLIVDLDVKTRHDIPLEELGFFPEQLDLIKKSVAESAGVVLLAAPDGQGLTTMEYSILRAHDAFVQHIQTVERAPDVELEGITQNELAPNASNAEELKLVRWVCSQQPDVVMITRIVEPKSAVELVRFGDGEKRAYVGLRASSAFHALDMWRKLVGDDKLALKNLRMVVAGRVMRKLCSACKVEYAPEPDTLRKLNMSPDKVGRLFQARTSPLRDPKGNPIPCEFCNDLRFKGRVGVFEVFSIDDEVRQVVESGASLDRLKMAFKKQKRKYMQEYAVARAVAGDTSLQEVARILRVGEPSGSSSKRTA